MGRGSVTSHSSNLSNRKTYGQLHAQAATMKHHTRLQTWGTAAHEILHFFCSHSSYKRICAFVCVQWVTEDNRRLYALPSTSENTFIILTNFNFPKVLLSYWPYIIKWIFNLIFGNVKVTQSKDFIFHNYCLLSVCQVFCCKQQHIRVIKINIIMQRNWTSCGIP